MKNPTPNLQASIIDHTFPTIALDPLARVVGGNAALLRRGNAALNRGTVKPFIPPRYNPRVGGPVAPAIRAHPESYVQGTVSNPMPGTDGHVPRGTRLHFPAPTFRYNDLGFFDD